MLVPLISVVLSGIEFAFYHYYCITEMVTENTDRAVCLQVAKRNHNICGVFEYSGVNRNTWRRMVQDKLLDQVNDTKVKLAACLLLLC